MIAFLLNFVWNLLRPSFDWLLRLFYGKSKLQRICDASEGGQRLSDVAKTLSQSRDEAVRRYATAANVNLDEAVAAILKTDGQSSSDNPKYAEQLRQSLGPICAVSNLLAELDKLRSPYDKSNPEHEEYLMELWRLLQPDTKLTARISKDWGTIGFQGDDPATDFRGMGLLGLLNLLYFAKQRTDQARHVLSCSLHPTLGYSFAIVGINMTGMAMELLKAGPLRQHFYATLCGNKPTVDNFHEVYCYIFYNFNQFWQDKKPENVMAFSRIREEFRQVLLEKLSNIETAALQL